MRRELAELWKFRTLLWVLVRRDLKVRYKNSRMGFFWSIAPPLLQVLVITYAFKNITGIMAAVPNYSAYLLVAMIPWTYTSTSLLDSSQSVLLMYGVIKKVYLPREIIPLSCAISNFIHFLLSWGVFFIYWYGFRSGPVLVSVLWVPYLIVCQFMLVTGLSFFISCLNVFYEDVKYILTVLLQLGLFLFPIMYIVEMMNITTKLESTAGKWAVFLYLNNPVTALMNGFRKTILQPLDRAALGDALKMDYMPLQPSALILTGFVCFGILVAGYAYFNSRKWHFVERP